ncbi:hypothetical protein GOODEAATRI_026092, partial [Goodea atripinnis]
EPADVCFERFLSFSVCLPTEEVNVLQELSLQVSERNNSFMTVEGSRCPVIRVGQYSTLTLPLQQIFSYRFADEFSLLVQLRSLQREEHSMFTMLSPDSHIMLQIRISAYAIIFIGTQQRHYELVFFFRTHKMPYHYNVSVLGSQSVACVMESGIVWPLVCPLLT